MFLADEALKKLSTQVSVTQNFIPHGKETGSDGKEQTYHRILEEEFVNLVLGYFKRIVRMCKAYYTL